MRPGALLVLAVLAVLGGAPSPASAGGEPAAAGTVAAPTHPTLVPLEVAIGIGGLTATALLALFATLIGRRRRSTANVSTRADDATAEEQVTAALHRRTLRRAHVRLDEDPIVAAIVVSPEGDPAVRPARRSGRRSPPT